MTPREHYVQGTRLEHQQAALAPTTHHESIVLVCHGAAYHFACAGVGWASNITSKRPPEVSTLPKLFVPVQAPEAVSRAWLGLEELVEQEFSGEGTPGGAATEARTWLTVIKRWAEQMQP